MSQEDTEGVPGTNIATSRRLRRAAIRHQSLFLGMDYIEVKPSDDDYTLLLHFIPPASGVEPLAIPALTPAHILIQNAGEQKAATDLWVKAVEPIEDSVVAVTVSRIQHAEQKEGRCYTLSCPGVKRLDPFFSTVSFRLDRESEFDPKPVERAEPPLHNEPDIDYLTRDYTGFRQLILNRASEFSSSWNEQNPADFGVALAELLAAEADRLSYFQDAVATEAYLGTARRRVSIARHARLIDYRMHEGSNARVWIHLQVEREIHLKSGTPFLTYKEGLPVTVSPESIEENGMPESCEVFESMHSVRLFPAHNELLFYTWDHQIDTLETGAVSACLKGHFPHLKRGDVLIFEEVKGRQTGEREDADLWKRHAVRLKQVTLTEDPVGKPNGGPEAITKIEWFKADALPFPMHLALNAGQRSHLSLIRGNVLLADHGQTIQEGSRLPMVPQQGRYRPEIPHAALSYSIPYDHEQAKKQPADSDLEGDVRTALPTLRLEGPRREEWRPVSRLLQSDRFVRSFVVEVENDRRVFLRFGDGKQGKAPDPGMEFTAFYRIGNGLRGNIGREVIHHALISEEGIIAVSNLLSPRGGTAPEEIEQVRLHAPRRLRTQERCVIPADYVQKIEAHSDVQRATAVSRWTGSRHTIFIAVDRVGSMPCDDEFCQSLKAYLEPFCIVGTDIRIEPPRFVPLDIAMHVQIFPGHFAHTVEQLLLEVFSPVETEDGYRGIFHPDRLHLGQSIYKSQLMTEALRLPGVAAVQVTRFHAQGCEEKKPLEEGVIPIAALEVARLDNKPDRPEQGRITFTVGGGE